MRDLRQATHDLTWPSLHHVQGRLLGLPFVLAACGPGLVFGWSACFSALMFASLATFLVYVPLTVLAMNGGGALGENAPIPPLTFRAYVVLLLLWSATAFLGAAAAAHLGTVG